MSKIMGIQFQKNGKIYYFDANGIESDVGTYVIVDTVHGLDLGEVILPPREMSAIPEIESLKKVVRVATEQDIQRGRENRIKEKEAFEICQRKITEHKLEMKLVSVEYSFDGNKILFYFTANGRVDFRSLVKDLASVFKTRIELRQIGVRDEAKMLGGLGPCGRPICCGSFLSQFQPVSIKMAKEQNLSLNPTKISGVCGRLMCCLKYEQDHYEQTRKKMPKVGRTVSTPDGNGPVTELNIIKETVFVRLTNGDTSEIKEYPLENIVRMTDPSFSDSNNNSDDSGNNQNECQTSQKVENREKDAKGKEEKRNQSKNRNHGKNHPLGQPVKRENPNRDNNIEAMKSKPETKNKPDNSAYETKKDNTETHGNDSKSTSSWADAVQNAMLAIDK
jgi:cell fate regulator YaaT (PSP1 superfamily)